MHHKQLILQVAVIMFGLEVLVPPSSIVNTHAGVFALRLSGTLRI